MASGTKKRKFKKGKPPNIKYKAEQRHEKSHVKRLKVHLSRYGLNDGKATACLEAYAQRLGVRAVQSAQEFLKQAA